MFIISTSFTTFGVEAPCFLFSPPQTHSKGSDLFGRMHANPPFRCTPKLFHVQVVVAHQSLIAFCYSFRESCEMKRQKRGSGYFSLIQEKKHSLSPVLVVTQLWDISKGFTPPLSLSHLYAHNATLLILHEPATFNYGRSRWIRVQTDAIDGWDLYLVFFRMLCLVRYQSFPLPSLPQSIPSNISSHLVQVEHVFGRILSICVGMVSFNGLNLASLASLSWRLWLLSS